MAAQLIKFARINHAADGAATIVAGVAGQHIVITGFVITGDTTAGIRDFQDTAGTPVVHATFNLAANGPLSAIGSRLAPLFEIASGEGFAINNAAGVDTLGCVMYYQTT